MLSSAAAQQQLGRSCHTCRLAHVGCDKQRPCARCVRLNKADCCMDPPTMRKLAPSISTEEAMRRLSLPAMHLSYQQPLLGSNSKLNNPYAAYVASHHEGEAPSNANGVDQDYETALQWQKLYRETAQSVTEHSLAGYNTLDVPPTSTHSLLLRSAVTGGGAQCELPAWTDAYFGIRSQDVFMYQHQHQPTDTHAQAQFQYPSAPAFHRSYYQGASAHVPGNAGWMSPSRSATTMTKPSNTAIGAVFQQLKQKRQGLPLYEDQSPSASIMSEASSSGSSTISVGIFSHADTQTTNSLDVQ